MDWHWNIDGVNTGGPELLRRWAFREYASKSVSGILVEQEMTYFVGEWRTT